MKTLLKVVGITLGVVVIAAVLVLGYFGFVPGVSSLFGSNKPTDLGVTYTEADRLSGRAKAGWEVVELPADTPPENSLVYSGQVAVDATFTNAELTAWANDPWDHYPLTDAQIRVNSDGTLEASGRLDIGMLRKWADIMGVTDEQLSVMEEYLGWFAWSDPPFYVKMSASVVGGEIVNPTVYEARLGRLSLPSGYLESSVSGLADYAGWQADATPGFSADSVEIVDGGIRFRGTMPAHVARSTR